MNFETYLNSLKLRKASELTVKEFALMVRYNTLCKLMLDDNGITDQVQVLTALEEEFNQARKVNWASTTTESGGGKELIPANVLVGNLIDLSNQWESYSFLSALMGKQILASKIQSVPIIGRTGKARILSEMASEDDIRKAKKGLQKANSGMIEIRSEKVYNNAILSLELQKYSVIEIEAIMLWKVKEGILLAVADAIINADNSDTTNNINTKGTKPSTIDSDFNLNSIYKYDNGLRKAALSNSTTKIEIWTVEWANDIFRLQAKVTSTSNPGKKIILMDQSTYYKYMEKEDFKDAAKNGKNSTIYTGAITNIAGSDVFVTDLLKPAGADGLVSSTQADNVTWTILVLDITAIQHGAYDDLKFKTSEDFAIGNIIEVFGFWWFENLQWKDGLNFVSIWYNVS